MAGQRLCLLDRFCFERPLSGPPIPIGVQRLLAFLALHGFPHRSVVAGTLWPEVPEAQALASLRTAVWRMNKFLPGVLVTQGPVLAMSEVIEVDSRKQEQFAVALLRSRVADPERLRSGIATLWPGELLPGWYDEWVVVERERLGQLRLRALELAAARLTAHRDLEVALQAALEAVRAEPLRETATAALIGVYLAEGNAAEAIHHYELFRNRLQRELGLEPSNRLREMLPPRVR